VQTVTKERNNVSKKDFPICPGKERSRKKGRDLRVAAPNKKEGGPNLGGCQVLRRGGKKITQVRGPSQKTSLNQKKGKGKTLVTKGPYDAGGATPLKPRRRK